MCNSSCFQKASELDALAQLLLVCLVDTISVEELLRVATSTATHDCRGRLLVGPLLRAPSITLPTKVSYF